MRLLLDTHVIVWAGFTPGRLSRATIDLLEDPYNQVFVSPISAYEVIYKYRKGHWPEVGDLANSWSLSLSQMGLVSLPLDETDTEQAAALDWNHRDPFDRMIVGQAISKDLVLVTADQVLLDFDEVTVFHA